MANVISKILMSEYSMPYNCYELGHTWTPYCSRACLDVGYFVFKESFKMYAGLYLTTHFISKRRLESTAFLEALKSVFRSSSFLGFNAFAAIACFCGTRKLMDKFYLPILGHIPATIASLMAIYLERKSRRPALAFYVTNVASESLYKMFLSKGFVKRFKYDELILFTLTMSTLMYLIKLNGYGNDFVSLVLRSVIGNEENFRRVEKKKMNGNVKENSCEQQIIPEINTTCKSENTSTVHFQFDNKYLKYIRSLKIYTFFKSIIDYKHDSCPHGNTCLRYTANGFIRGFIPGYIFSSLIQVLKRPKLYFKDPSNFLNLLKDQKCFKFALFLASFSSTFKATNCLLRMINNGDNAWQTSLAAFCASFALLFSPNPTITQYLFWKSIETVYFLGIKNGYIKHGELKLNILYAFSVAQLFYVSVVHPEFMRQSYLKFMLRMTNNYIAKLNRNIINTLGVRSTAGFDLFVPNLQYEHTSKKFKEAVLMWMVQ
ncbi:transmembrane protein 135-like protein [Leptotrombidium deliense]|uniref:Transmembrane protein 135-like protein n=1 Tax=Leptotrombidium deliense TaxID=299467 RepID=A0A443S6T0_9ACAR|nr:transmembrane protein 135-like protein [Leptotrombidium deliense]